MTTNLLVKSSYALDEPVNQDIKELTEHITGKEVTTSLCKNTQYDMDSPVYCVEYKDNSELKKHIEKFYEHRYTPFDGFDHIEAFDFTLSLESEDINDAYQFLQNSDLTYNREEINMLDYIVSDVVHVQEEQKDKIQALYDFIDSTGLRYYKEVTDIMLTVLQKNGQIDMDQIKNITQKTTH